MLHRCVLASRRETGAGDHEGPGLRPLSTRLSGVGKDFSETLWILSEIETYADLA